jgi:hypothetical protein
MKKIKNLFRYLKMKVRTYFQIKQVEKQFLNKDPFIYK